MSRGLPEDIIWFGETFDSQHREKGPGYGAIEVGCS